MLRDKNISRMLTSNDVFIFIYELWINPGLMMGKEGICLYSFRHFIVSRTVCSKVMETEEMLLLVSLPVLLSDLTGVYKDYK